jgi:hypothetical protein
MLLASLALGLQLPLWPATTFPRAGPPLLTAESNPLELRESAVAEREQAVAQREQAVAQRERAMLKREDALREREAAAGVEPAKRGGRITSYEAFRKAMANGVSYKTMDIRGDSSALLGASEAAHQVHPVVAALYKRKQQGSKAGARRDGMKIALAIEGGGMRGVVAAGMAAAISELGLVDSVDAVYGSSAGSLIGAYLLSGQDYRYGCSVYYDDLCRAGPAFINLRNSLRSLGFGALRMTPTGLKEMFSSRLGTPVLNLDFLLEEVLRRQKPLDWEGLKAPPLLGKGRPPCLTTAPHLPPWAI